MSGPLSTEVMVSFGGTLTPRVHGQTDPHSSEDPQKARSNSRLYRSICIQCKEKLRCISNLMYKEAETRTAVDAWLINTIDARLTTYKNRGSDKGPSENTHCSDHGPVRIISERLFDGTRRRDCETSEGIQRNCSDESNDPPCEEDQR